MKLGINKFKKLLFLETESNKLNYMILNDIIDDNGIYIWCEYFGK